MNKALLCDLDGTIITTRSGRDFPLHSADWKFIEKTLECINHHHKSGYTICIVSNQGGIEMGYTTVPVFEKKINDVCDAIENILKLPKGTINYIYCTKMESYNRKPNPGMAYDLATEYELDLKNSIMIGDMDSDKGFRDNAGIGKYININEVEFIEWNRINLND